MPKRDLKLRGVASAAVATVALLVCVAAVFSADIPIATVPTGRAPDSVAIDPVLNRIWVGNFYGDSVTVIDGASDTVATTVPMPIGTAIGAVPNAIVIDPIAVTPKAYIANWQSHRVSIVNATTYAKIATITVPTANGGNPRALALNPSSSPPKLYVANYHRDVVSVLNATDGSLIKEIPVGSSPRALGIFITAPRERIYVANRYSNNVTVIDGQTDSVVATVATGAGPKSIAIEPGTGDAFVSSPTSDTVTVIGAADTAVATLTVGDNPVGVGVEPKGKLLFVANYLSNNVSVFDSRTYARVATVAAGPGPFAVGIDDGDRKAFVTNYGGSSVTIIDRNLVATDCPTGAGPYAIAANQSVTPHKTYAANWTSDTVTVIDEPAVATAPVGFPAVAGAPQAQSSAGEIAAVPPVEPLPVTVTVNPLSGDATLAPQPVFTGTAQDNRSPYVANIVAVFVSVDGGAMRPATIISGAGTPGVTWSFQPDAPLAVGPHSVRAFAFDQLSAASASSGQDQVALQAGPAGDAAYSFTVQSLAANPHVDAITPVCGSPGTTVTISGTGFGAVQGSGWVTFWGLSAPVVSWSDTSIQALVPVGATTGYVGVVQDGVVSNGKWFVPFDRPRVNSLLPANGSPGTTITIAGTGFGATQGSGWATFGGVSAPVVSWSDTSVAALVPMGATPGYAGIVQNGLTSNGKWFLPYARPAVTAVSPSFGSMLTTVTITGTGFGATQGSGWVTFWGVSAPVVSWSDTSVVTLVPAGAVSGYCGIVQNGMTSNGKWFTVLSGPASFSTQAINARVKPVQSAGITGRRRALRAPQPRRLR